MEAIAESVSGATTSLVEQVLDEYGDPGGAPADEAASATEDAESTAATEQEPTANGDADSISDQSAMSDHSSGADESTGDPDAVTTKQLETLREICERPRATQAELADRLGVSGATISQRVNGIDGFDWSERQAFVDRFFDQEQAALEGRETDPAGTETQLMPDSGRLPRGRAMRRLPTARPTSIRELRYRPMAGQAIRQRPTTRMTFR